MKKIVNFLRSMRFGILLMVMIAACSVVGSVIPQGREVVWYAQNYTQIHSWLLTLGLDHVFQGWFFIALLVLLCLNLSLCSLVRVRSLAKDGGELIARTASLPTAEKLDESVRREWATRRIYALIAAYTANPKEDTLRDMRIFANHYKIAIPYEKEIK